MISHPVAQWRDGAVALVWPDDNNPRISFLRGIANDDDLGGEKVTSKWFSWFSGEKATRLPFVSPYGVAADGRGRIWVADRGIQGVHVIDLARKDFNYIFQAGDVQLQSPVGVSIDQSRGRLYVSDSGLVSVFCFDLSGRYLSHLEPPDGFGRPGGLAVDSQGRVFVVDNLKNRITVFTSQGDYVRQLVGDVVSGISLHSPTNVAVDKFGHVAVVDSMNFRVVLFGADGELIKSFGQAGVVPGSFARPRGVAFDSDGHIYVVDAAFSNVQIFDIAGRLLMYFSGDGDKPGSLSLPSGIYIDQDDRVYVADAYNRRLQLFQYLPGRDAIH